MISGESLEQFRNNLKKISNFTHAELSLAMKKAQVLVANDAKRDHEYIGNAIGAHNPEGHPSDRYYTHSGKLTNSIRPGEVESTAEEIKGEVKAGDSSMTTYAAFVESKYTYLELALENESYNILQLFAKAVGKVLGSA
jgi:hypothetical protein